jgi:hypothetical protein
MSPAARPPLRARFVRAVGERDRVYVRRSDGSETSWVFPSFGDGLPHDLVHLVVERDFGVRDGFWGRVDRGVEPAKINEDASRVGGKGKYGGFGPDLQQLLLAEVLANCGWFHPGADDEARRAEAARQCAEQGIELPARVTVAALAQTDARLRELQVKWRGLKPKGTIELEFGVEAPRS